MKIDPYRIVRIIDIVFIIIGIYAFIFDDMPLAAFSLTIVLGMQVFLMLVQLKTLRENKREMKIITEMIINTHYEAESIREFKKSHEDY
jgi:ABC-type bacteriocin/lantibiotic exporter with double-glycine peptidase domain